jgi:hypothetical protein
MKWVKRRRTSGAAAETPLERGNDARADIDLAVYGKSPIMGEDNSVGVP